MVVDLADVALDLLVGHAEPAQVAPRLLATLADLGFLPALVLQDAMGAFGTAALDARRQGPDDEGERDGEQDDGGEREPLGAWVCQDHRRTARGRFMGRWWRQPASAFRRPGAVTEQARDRC